MMLQITEILNTGTFHYKLDITKAPFTEYFGV